MAADFPVSIPAALTASGSDTLATAGHTAIHTKERDEVRALAQKLGTGSSAASANTVLRGTGGSASAWGQIQAGDMAPGAAAPTMLLNHSATADIVNGSAFTAGSHSLGTAHSIVVSGGTTSMIEVSMRGAMIFTSASTWEGVSAVGVNGTQHRIGGGNSNLTGNHPISLDGKVWLTGLAAGTYTLQPHVQVNALGTAYLRANSLAPYEHLSLQVVEFK